MMDRPLEVLISAFYILTILSILVIKYSESLNGLLKYGKTYENVRSTSSLINFITTITVPKKWFLHFYVIYFGCCLLSGCFLTLLLKDLQFSGYVASIISMWLPSSLESSPAKFKQYKIIFYLICFQSSRRLLESLYITKFSPKAKINVCHYIMGLAFYTSISLNCLISLIPYYIKHSNFHVKTELDLIDKAMIAVFIIFSIDQYQNHRHLSTLPKYSLPTFRMFRLVGSAHYFDEIMLYLVIAIMACLQSNLSIIDVNYILSSLFVTVNLSVSSLESFAYYKAKYPLVIAEYSIIPGFI